MDESLLQPSDEPYEPDDDTAHDFDNLPFDESNGDLNMPPPEWSIEGTSEKDVQLDEIHGEPVEGREESITKDLNGSQLSSAETNQIEDPEISHPVNKVKMGEDLSISMSDTELSNQPPQAISGYKSVPEADLNLIKIFLRSSGNKKRDALRMRRVYGLLTTFHGVDRFSVFIFEGSRKYHLEFPNDTTGYCPELHTKLRDLVGDANVQIEPLRLQ